MFIFGLLMFVVFVMIVIQIYLIFSKPRYQYDGSAYTEETLKQCSLAFGAVKNGSIRKHILINGANEFDGKAAREAYIKFVSNSSFFNIVSSLSGSRYDG